MLGHYLCILLLATISSCQVTLHVVSYSWHALSTSGGRYLKKRTGQKYIHSKHMLPNRIISEYIYILTHSPLVDKAVFLNQ